MNRPLSIVMPLHGFDPGGVERVGLNLARAWHEAGEDVCVVLGRNGGIDSERAPELRYVVRESRFATPRFETLWMIWWLYGYLRRHRADVIFCAGNTYMAVCVAMRLLLGPSCPPVVAKVSNDLVRADKNPVRRRLYHIWIVAAGLVLDRLVGMAESMREEIARYMDVPDERIAIIPDPGLTQARLDKLLAIPAPGQDAGTRFVAVGRLARQKNFALLLRAFAEGRCEGDTLTMVGDGSQRADLERLASDLGIAGSVRFTGHLASPDEELARADCLLMSSTFEGVPAVVIEAIAAGLPVIATRCSVSMPELLGLGVRGELVPVGDAAALARAIQGARAPLRLPDNQRRYAAAFTVEKARELYLAEMRLAGSGSKARRVESAAGGLRKRPLRGV